MRAAGWRENPSDDEEDSMSLGAKINYILATTYLGRLVDAMNITLSVTSCLLHVVDTYLEERPAWFMVADALISMTFCCYFVLNMVRAKKKVQHLTSPHTFVEIVSIVPTVTIGMGSDVSFTVLCIRLLRVLRISNVFIVMKYIQNEIEAQLFNIGLTILTITFVSASLIELFENLPEYQPDDLPPSHADGLSFHNSFYFIITTMTTVGYGDISPVTGMGKLIIMGMIGATFLLIPKETNKLVALLATQSVYVRQSFHPSSAGSHIIICGSVGSVRPGAIGFGSRTGGSLLPFFREFFNDDHGSVERSAVVLARGQPSSQLQSLLSHPKYALGITYLDGNVMEAKDLKRSCAEFARAVFIMSNKDCADSNAEDASTILRALAIKRYVFERTGRDIMTCVQLLRPENKALFYSTTDAFSRAAAAAAAAMTPAERILNQKQITRSEDRNDPHSSSSMLTNLVVCVDEMKMNLMAMSCVCPGIITMLYNLVASDDDSSLAPSAPDWQKEYETGCSYEIYRVPLSPKFTGTTFSEAAHAVYAEAGVCLFALELHSAGSSDSRVLLNPANMQIPSRKKFILYGFVIAEDKREADVVTSFGTKDSDKLDSRRLLNSARNLNAVTRAFPSSKRIDLSDSEVDSSSTHKKATKPFTPPNTARAHLPEASRVPSLLLSTTDTSLPLPIRNHIILCCGRGIDANRLFHFVRPLRAAHIVQQLRVVVLQSSVPSKQTLAALSDIPHCHFMVGSALEASDLQRAGVNDASSIVIFSEDTNAAPGASDAASDALVDAETICIYRLARSLNARINISCELIEEGNMSFLANMSSASGFLRSAAFAAGHVFSSSVLDIILCQAFFNPHIVTILEAIISAGSPLNAQIWRSSMQGTIGDVVESHLYLIQLPAAFVGQSYGVMFQKLLLGQGIMCLGLRRAGSNHTPASRFAGSGVHGTRSSDTTSRGNVLPYVYTNPSKDTTLQQHDSVFVLSQDPPVSTTISSANGAVAAVQEIGGADSSAMGEKPFNLKSAEIATQQIQHQRSSFEAMPASPTRSRAKLSAALDGAERGAGSTHGLQAFEALSADIADLRAAVAHLHQSSNG